MYLSRVPLNPARRGTRKFLTSPQVIHAAVLSSFPPGTLEQPDNQGRVLWRIDQHDNAMHLYVVSPAEPDFTHIVEQTGWPTTTAWATRKYGELLDTLVTGQRWHFRLTANPVRRTMNPTGASTRKRGAVGGLKADEQLDWLRRKASDNGFELAPCGPVDLVEDDVRIVGRQSLQFRRGAASVSLSTATFEGVLIVSDPARLRSALTHGIGRAKGYGCGLLTLAPNR
ncbi:type I-E CRISPR-associated protein Cas6/Cse3/CasE (plasmid) [Nocardia sp. CWNU-33]|uniref:type I-E CRISPR-associated protein Cas6/Cse3/CasE n=1 Tax=Nocardia sp. CWNU-33 TaxID=3392117 RepID=UPI00398F6B4C